MRETLDIYAPLAARLGMYAIKMELEDIALKFLEPEAYYDLAEQVSERKGEREDAINDVVEGFELGANDYLKKPFGMQELIVRLKALMHKAFIEKEVSHSYEIETISQPVTQQLTFAGATQELSHRESEILKRLCNNRNEVVSSQSILLELWVMTAFSLPQPARIHYQAKA